MLILSTGNITWQNEYTAILFSEDEGSKYGEMHMMYKLHVSNIY